MFGITSPWMLAGLAGAGLPVLIHFLTRARPRVIRYPTYHLLVEAGTGKQALHRLRTWIILALRTLAVAALALAFSRPFLKSAAARLEPGQPQRAVLVVDASMSMRAVEGGIPLFAKARAQAADVLRGLEDGSAAAVVFIGTGPRAALPALSRNLPALHEALSSAEATLEKGDPAAALALAERLLDGHGAVYVFSDFQRTNWGPVALDGFKGLDFFLRPVVARGVDNVGIVAAAKSPAEPVEGETIELACTVFNATPARRLETVRLDLEGVSQETDLALQPYASATATFSFSMPGAGCYPGRLSLAAADDLACDNTHYFKVRVRRALRVLLVSDADPGDASSAAFFVATALAPSEYADTGMKVIRRRSQEVDRESLETADAYFLVGPATLGGDCLDAIARRVTEGACLACFLDGPGAPALVGALGGASGGAITPPFTLARPVAARAGGDPFGVLPGLEGPLKAFGSPDQGDLTGLLFRRHWLTDPAPGRKEEVLIAFPDGSAALAISPAGRGTAIFANFPVAPDGSDLAGSPLFPALLAELMRALRSSGAEAALTPGTPWHIDVADPGDCNKGTRTLFSDGGGYRVVGPDGRELEALVVARGRTVRLALPPAHLPGHYPVTRDGHPAEVGVVNVHPKETDTRPLNVADLLTGAGPAAGGTVSILTDEGQLTGAGKPTALWPHLAAAVVVCLAAEMLLLAVWRRRRREAAAQRLEGRAQ